MKSKILLIAHYWYPFNNSGTFRWVNFGKYIDFDVFTTKVPVNSFYDETIPQGRGRVFRFGNKLPAVVWGFVAPLLALFKRYDLYIFTCPPESLLFWAFVYSLLGKKVVVDMRDSIDREHQPLKFLVPFYSFFYNRIRNVIVSWKFLDESKPCVYNGFDDITGSDFKGYYTRRVNHGDYLKLLEDGYMPDQSHKPRGYAASSLHTFKHLGYPVNNKMHKEAETADPQSYQVRSNEILTILNQIK